MHASHPSPSPFEGAPRRATPPQAALAWRTVGRWSTLLAVPAAYALGSAVSRRTGVLAGGLALVGLGALRWQLARWFTATPQYEALGRAGAIELRRYPFRIEARSELDARDLETALDLGYSRLEVFVYGANEDGEHIESVVPVLTTPHDGVYSTAFVMPPGRSVASLPQPDDVRVELREVSERVVAVLRFRGTLGSEHVLRQEQQLRRALGDAGLVAHGPVTVATYDAPTTLPALRRTELWIEVAR